MKSWLIGAASGICRMLGKHGPWTQSEPARVAPSLLEIADGSVRPTAEPFTQLPLVAADGMVTWSCGPWEGDVAEPAFGTGAGRKGAVERRHVAFITGAAACIDWIVVGSCAPGKLATAAERGSLHGPKQAGACKMA